LRWKKPQRELSTLFLFRAYRSFRTLIQAKKDLMKSNFPKDEVHVAKNHSHKRVGCLSRRYEGLMIPTYKLKKWFSSGQKVFFDCEDSDEALCLERILSNADFSAFIIYLIVKGTKKSYDFMDVSFRNLGKETLKHFITRYHQQLETMTKLSLQTVGPEFIECPGHSYQERTLDTKE
jgi:hypothetical protein